jgi:protoporphyrinogen oxidase
LTGLSAARHLHETKVDFLLLEQDAEPGGLARTTIDHGYRFDRTGHLLHLSDDAVRTEVLAALPEPPLLLERRSVVYSNGVVTPYPFQANTHGLPPEVAYECVMGFLEARGRSHQAPRNFEQFCLQNFGAGFSKHFMLPYNRRAWGVAPQDLGVEWAERFVPIPRVEDVIAGAVGLSRPLGYNQTFLYPRHGIGELPAALGRNLPNVRSGERVVAVDAARRCVTVQRGDVPGHDTVHYDAVITTLPLPQFARMLVEAPLPVVDAARRLRSTELYYLDLAVQAPCPRPVHWMYVPEERFPFHRVGCYSNFSAAMAPDGCSSLYAELVQRPPPPLAELLPAVLRGLVEVGMLRSPEDVEFARLRWLPHAYVVYDAEREEARRLLHEHLRRERILSAGRYGDWNYSSMQDALLFGRQAAAEVLSWLR